MGAGGCGWSHGCRHVGVCFRIDFFFSELISHFDGQFAGPDAKPVGAALCGRVRGVGISLFVEQIVEAGLYPPAVVLPRERGIGQEGVQVSAVGQGVAVVLAAQLYVYPPDGQDEAQALRQVQQGREVCVAPDAGGVVRQGGVIVGLQPRQG